LIDEGKPENFNPMMNGQQPSPSLTWDPTGKRDPFKPYRAPRAIKQNSDVIVDPLTLLDLSQVQVVAILWNNKNPRAVIRGSGKLFTIFKRTNIGPNNGIVAEIREGEVIVIETFDDGFGNIVKEVKPLRLNKPSAQPGSVSSGS
jgi:type IV pilus assembly protein PilP